MKNPFASSKPEPKPRSRGRKAPKPGTVREDIYDVPASLHQELKWAVAWADRSGEKINMNQAKIEGLQLVIARIYNTHGRPKE